MSRLLDIVARLVMRAVIGAGGAMVGALFWYGGGGSWLLGLGGTVAGVVLFTELVACVEDGGNGT